jgi:putative salt-induced outer membrane protein YdiY
MTIDRLRGRRRRSSTSRPGVVLSISLLALCGAGLEDAHAQETDQAKAGTKDEIKLGWSNTSDLSLVLTAGNSDSVTLGFSDKLGYRWKTARFNFDVSVVRSDKSDDWFFQVVPGLEFPVGGAPSNPAATLVKPEPTLDVGNYLVRGAYEKDISPRLFWNVGASWYRNDDAGILNRYIVFAGLGNNWVDTQRRRFATSYGISYTDREEEEPDPEKDRRFSGARFGWDYTEHLNAVTTFDSDFGSNVSFADVSDYSINTLNALSVAMNSRLALKVSLQWLFENEPALEPDLDVVARVEVVNPDGVPGHGRRTLSHARVGRYEAPAGKVERPERQTGYHRADSSGDQVLRPATHRFSFGYQCAGCVSRGSAGDGAAGINTVGKSLVANPSKSRAHSLWL